MNCVGQQNATNADVIYRSCHTPVPNLHTRFENGNQVIVARNLTGQRTSFPGKCVIAINFVCKAQAVNNFGLSRAQYSAVKTITYLFYSVT